MKKVLLTTCLFLFAIQASWAAEAQKSAPTRIHCELVPVYRGSNPYLDYKPNKHIRNGTSSNWSGYFAATSTSSPQPGSVSQAIGSWTVPAVSATPSDAFSSAWVGIDGAGSNTVEQLGTEQDWIGGQAQYYAWYEMFPRGSFLLRGFPVNPGDLITARVKYKGNGRFRLSIQNVTQNVVAVVPKKKTRNANALRLSAEWIMEAPSAGGILPLANFGVIDFCDCNATINGVNGPINNSSWQNEALTMEENNVVKAVPSGLSNGGQNFSVTWYHE